jgi:hypothetical protein
MMATTCPGLRGHNGAGTFTAGVSCTSTAGVPATMRWFVAIHPLAPTTPLLCQNGGPGRQFLSHFALT